MAYATPSTKAAAVFTAEQQALGRVGIKVTPATADASIYYSTFIGSPSEHQDAGSRYRARRLGCGLPDAVTVSGTRSPTASDHPATGNTNYPSLNDPQVNGMLEQAPKGTVTEDRLEAVRRSDHEGRGVPADLLRTRPCTTATRG